MTGNYRIISACLGLSMAATAVAANAQNDQPSSGSAVREQQQQPSGTEDLRLLKIDLQLARLATVTETTSPAEARYDYEIARIVPEGEAILAAGDQKRAYEWSQKYHELLMKRGEVVSALNRATVAALGDRHPDPCLDPMGRNQCAAPAPATNQNWCVFNAGSASELVPCNN